MIPDKVALVDELFGVQQRLVWCYLELLRPDPREGWVYVLLDESTQQLARCRDRLTPNVSPSHGGSNHAEDHTP